MSHPAGTDRTSVVETERLVLRRLTVDDAAFIHELLNEPSFLRFIGDKDVRDLEGARRYIRNGPMESYRRFGFGLYLTARKADETPLGICGLLKRDALPDVDVGFAFLPRFWSKGYALEAAAAVVSYGRERFGLRRVVAITTPDNRASIRVLEKLGLRFQESVRLSDQEPPLHLFAADLSEPALHR